MGMRIITQTWRCIFYNRNKNTPLDGAEMKWTAQILYIVRYFSFHNFKVFKMDNKAYKRSRCRNESEGV